jgi:hypothetical protein
MIQAILLILVGAAGIWFTARHLRKNWLEIRARKGTTKVSDIVLNQGLSLVWFGYLFVFFVGLIVNNLLLK